MKICKLCVEIEYDPDATDPEALVNMMDHLFGGVAETFRLTEDYGHPVVGEFFVAEEDEDD